MLLLIGLLSVGCGKVVRTLDPYSPSLLYQKDGATAGDRLGYPVSGAGYVNGDGYADFIIGAPYADPSGKAYAGSAYVYSGADGSVLYQKDGTAAADMFGRSLSGAGDVNGDGYADFIIGAAAADPSSKTNAGSAYVYSGADGSLLYRKDGEAANDSLGGSVSGAGDLNGDGYADFIIGAAVADPSSKANAGSAYVYSGADGSLLYQKDGAAVGNMFGISVSGAGDLNGDGYADFIVGASTAPSSKSNAGSAYIYSGADGTLLYQKDGEAANDNLGTSVSGAGDLNGDGYADFIVGAAGSDPGSKSDAGSAYVYVSQ